MGEELYQVISKAVMEGEEEEAVRRVNEALEAGLPPLEIIDHRHCTRNRRSERARF